MRVKLTLVRDRLGIKPLPRGLLNGCFAFASELKALTALPDWTGEIDRDALAAFLRYDYVPAPKTIYRGVNKLPPGMLLEYRHGSKPMIHVYWSLAEVSEMGQASPLDLSDQTAIVLLE